MHQGYSRFWRNTRGVTLIELMIASGIMALVAAGVATGIYGVVSQQSALTQRMDGAEFLASLSRALSDKSKCQSFMSGKVVPGGTAWQPTQIANYTGFGERPGAVLQAGYIINGTSMSPQLQIREFMWRMKPGSTGEVITLYVNAANPEVDHVKTAMQLRVVLDVRDQGQMRQLPARYIEFEVLRRASDGLITACDGTPTLVDACVAMNTNYNPATGTCIPAGQTCQMMGSYARSWCNRTDYPCRAAAQVPSRTNPYTNAYSCPSGSTPSASYVHSWVSQERAGKKWSANVTNYVEVYMCLRCQ